MERRRGRLGEHHRRVEVAIVDLVAARAAEELGAIHVNGDLVPWRHRLRVGRRMGGSGRRVAVDASARHARVEARAASRFAALAAARHLVRVPPDRGASTRRLDPEAVL